MAKGKGSCWVITDANEGFKFVGGALSTPAVEGAGGGGDWAGEGGDWADMVKVGLGFRV